MNELEIEEVRRCLDARWDHESALKTRELLEKSINKELNFSEYLEYDDGTDYFYELWSGELVRLPPDSGTGCRIALWLMMELSKFTNKRLVFPSRSCEIQVPGNPQNRYPKLIVLKPEHLELVKERLTITIDMPPPQLVVEVVTPYNDQDNEKPKCNYIDKRQQYQERNIPEYWIIDIQSQIVSVLLLVNGSYQATDFTGNQPIISQVFSDLELTAVQILEARNRF